MARTDMFLKVTGQRTGVIQGESNDKRFSGQIELVDWSWGMSAQTAVGGQRTGRTQFDTVKIVKHVDRASTALMGVLDHNELLTEVTISVRKAGGSSPLPYLIVKLNSARVVTYAVQSDVTSSGAPVLAEHVSFGFQKVQVDYVPQEGTGSGGGGMSWAGEVSPA